MQYLYSLVFQHSKKENMELRSKWHKSVMVL